MGGKHARNAPSDASRWTRCARALEFTKDFPDESSVFADEGTAGHLIRDLALDTGLDAYHFIGTKVSVNGALYECDDEMADHLQPGIDELREFPGKLFVETRVDTTKWVGLDSDGNRQGGTLDALVVGEYLAVQSDLKYGQGVAVSPVDNEQQLLYLLAAYKQIIRHIAPKCKKFLIIIDQPRNSAGGGYWTVTLDELLKFGEWIKVRAAATRDPNAEFTPGPKQCSWCKGANVPGRPGGCPAHAKWLLSEVDLGFANLDIQDEFGIPWVAPKVDSLTPARLVQLSLSKKAIEQFLEYAHAQALGGRA